MTFRKVNFASGHDLKDFATNWALSCRQAMSSNERENQDDRLWRTNWVWRPSLSVEIPASRNAPVVIVEDYGYEGQEGGIQRDEERVILKRPSGRRLRHCPTQLNDRLKTASPYGPLAYRFQPGGSTAGQGVVRASPGRLRPLMKNKSHYL